MIERGKIRNEGIIIEVWRGRKKGRRWIEIKNNSWLGLIE